MQCLVSILLLVVLYTTDGLDNRVTDRADRIAFAESPPLVPLLETHNCKALERCPDTDLIREHRQSCFNPPPKGHVYHCGTTKKNEIVEFFYRKFPCRKGFYGVPVKHDNGITLSCKQCPADRFNPELRWSPENMDQCQTHYHKPKDQNAIEYLLGNSSAPAVSYCNYRKGWASANEEMFCRESYQPCNCVYRLDSCKTLELLPDDSCEPWCPGHRLPENNFSCTQLEQPQTLSEVYIYRKSSRATVSIEPTPIEATKEIPPGTDFTPNNVPYVHIMTNGLSPERIALIISGCLAVTIAAGFVMYKKRMSLTKSIRTRNTNGESNEYNNSQDGHLTLNSISTEIERESLIREAKNETHDIDWIVNIPESLRTRRLDERDISKLGQALGSGWEIIMHNLQLPNASIDHAKMDNQYSAINQICSALNMWRVQNPTTATLGNFLRACLECQQCTTIDLPKVQTIIQQFK